MSGTVAIVVFFTGLLFIILMTLGYVYVRALRGNQRREGNA